MKSKFDLKAKIIEFIVDFTRLLSFFVLLVIYILDKIVVMLLGIVRINPQRFPQFFLFGRSIYIKISDFFDYREKGSISTYDLIELSFRNLKMKKVRTLVTIGGMTIGISAVVFLVSVGYGLQDLVISRVAKLDEIKQIDVNSQPGSKMKLNDEIISNIKGISAVDTVLPLIAVVGRVNYQSSISDVAVYGVTKSYLEGSAIKPSKGTIFESNEISNAVPAQVKGAKTEAVIGEYKKVIGSVEVLIPETKWIEVRELPSIKSKLLGYTKRPEGTLQGKEVWGYSYNSSNEIGNAGVDLQGNSLGKWVKVKIYIWKKVGCSTLTDAYCIDGKYTALIGNNTTPTQYSGYMTEKGVVISSVQSSVSEVLGAKTTSTTPDWVTIPSESDIKEQTNIKKVDMPKSDKREAVVNTSMLSVLGMQENEAVGKKILTSFVVVGDLLQNPEERIESSDVEYTIVGVIPDEKSPVIYVPFIDLRSLGVVNFSQLKVKVKEENKLSQVRSQIEGMGFTTNSVVDTVAQITNLFSTFRTLLALIGMVALSVAALGMFNTLTVSLLERTREVGLMKAMGMKSSEIQELFLTESMIIGFFGGVLGIFVGFLFGKGLGLLLSVLTIFRGAGFVDVAKIPFLFTLTIILLSLFVGVVTGIYPASRATKISALDALRYE